MIELVFIACLISSPDRCEERGLQFINVPSPMACMMSAQPQLARWAERNPKWEVARWRCRFVGSEGQEA